MEQLYLCAHCSEENEIQIDTGDGDRQKLTGECSRCGRPNLITAQYNFISNEFDLIVASDASE